MVKVQFDWDHVDCPLFYSPEGFPIDGSSEREHWPEIGSMISEGWVADLNMWARQMCEVYTADAAVSGKLEASRDEIDRLDAEYFSIG